MNPDSSRSLHKFSAIYSFVLRINIPIYVKILCEQFSIITSTTVNIVH